MDIYYMSDSIQYSSFRGPVYRDYEKFPYGTLENPLNNPVSKSKQQQRQQQRHHSSSNSSSNSSSSSTASAQAKLLSYIGKTSSGTKASKDACPFCKEQKKRPLGAYMRKRGQRITSESISEDAEELREEDEEEEEEEDVCASTRSNELSGSPPNGHQHMHRGIPSVAGFNRQESIESK